MKVSARMTARIMKHWSNVTGVKMRSNVWPPMMSTRNAIWMQFATAWMRPAVSGRVKFWMTVRRMTYAAPVLKPIMP